MTDKPSTELEAFQQIHSALVSLDEEAQARVISSVSTLLGIGMPAAAPERPNTPTSGEYEEGLDTLDNGTHEQTFSEFAELYAVADPLTNADKALVAGYWLQACQGAENFTGHSVNAELNHLGHKLVNITDAMSKLISVKPNQVLQLRKSGKSQQARKTYKLSVEGIKRAKEMISAA